MAADKMRFMNTVQTVRIKREKLQEAEEDAVQCKLCGKRFASPTALANHARVEHLEQYAAGEQLCVAPRGRPAERALRREEARLHAERNTQRLISSMSPTDLTSFASPEVSYIIIKTERDERPQRRRDARRRERPDGAADKIVVRNRDPLPISGPFECLQPSTQVADGACHQMFFSCCEYSAHYRDEHTRRRKGLKCQVCEKVLGGQSGAEHACDTCGKGFESQAQLARHVATSHVKHKPFHCTICQKRFTQQGGLQQHLRMHTGDRPYSCTVCPKAFTQKSGLEQHLRIHTKVRPYRCVICSKTFCQSIHLKQHMRTHTNVSPFQCALCHKRFKQSSHLNYHLKYHNPANMSDEQRLKYDELMGLMGKAEAEAETEAEAEAEGTVTVEVAPGQMELYEIVQAEEEGADGDTVQTEYILGDCVVMEP